MKSRRSKVSSIAIFVVIAARAVTAGDSSPAPILGSWQGSSTCVNRELAPACKDESVIYDIRQSEKAEVVTVSADKIVDGKRLPMGDLDFSYSSADKCWRSELQTPRFHGVWCLVVQGDDLTGTLRVLPDNATVREVKLKRRS